jgi:hypothetical protein
MSCGRSTAFFLRLSLSLEAQLLNPSPLLHQSVAQGRRSGVLAFWKGGKKASSKTMELGRGTHDKGERGARSGLRQRGVPQGVGVIGGGLRPSSSSMPKNKNKKCSAVFRLQRVSE